MKVGIIGVGNIGSSLAKLMIKNGFAKNLTVSDIKIDNINSLPVARTSNHQNIIDSDIIFVSVKPNIVKQVITDINNYGHDDKLIVSTAAAVPVNYMEDRLASEYYPIIRTMPNIVVKDGKGSIPYFCNANVKEHHIDNLKELLKGPYLLEVRRESLIDVSTVLTAAMPAFVSYTAESHIDFGIKNGFSVDECIKLYTSTLEATANMLKEEYTEDVISKVATPNGVTKQGLDQLERNGVRYSIDESLVISLKSIRSITHKLD